jgi:hypothetical protein
MSSYMRGTEKNDVQRSEESAVMGEECEELSVSAF